MNDTTYTASVLDAQRAEDLRREVALRAQRAERAADTGLRTAAAESATTAAAAAGRRRGFAWHRRERRATFLATR